MTPTNSYITRTDFLNWIATLNLTNTQDDPIVDEIVEEASRDCDQEVGGGRHFYPLYATRKYNYPRNPPMRQTDTLLLDDDLLSLTSFTNGDGTAITSTDYNLLDVNYPPYWGLQIKDVSSVAWATNTAGSSQQVLLVNGLWGYHPQYATQAWTAATTLNGAITDTTGLTWNVTSGAALVVGNIVQIDTELLIVSSIVTNAVTFAARGQNGSTAATHLTGTTIYLWNVFKPVRTSTFEIAQSIYKRRHGQDLVAAKLTAMGVVLAPGDIPQSAKTRLLKLAVHS